MFCVIRKCQSVDSIDSILSHQTLLLHVLDNIALELADFDPSSS